MTETQLETGVLAGDGRMLIGGELQGTANGATFDVAHPASEQVAGQAADGTVDDMARAVAAARQAFDTTDWSRDVEFRYHCLMQLHAALENNKERLRPHPDHRGGLSGQRDRFADRESDRGGPALGRARPIIRVSARHRSA